MKVAVRSLSVIIYGYILACLNVDVRFYAPGWFSIGRRRRGYPRLNAFRSEFFEGSDRPERVESDVFVRGCFGS